MRGVGQEGAGSKQESRDGQGEIRGKSLGRKHVGNKAEYKQSDYRENAEGYVYAFVRVGFFGLAAFLTSRQDIHRPKVRGGFGGFLLLIFFRSTLIKVRSAKFDGAALSHGSLVFGFDQLDARCFGFATGIGLGCL